VVAEDLLAWVVLDVFEMECVTRQLVNESFSTKAIHLHNDVADRRLETVWIQTQVQIV
jgi:hypothetical protein